MSSKSVETGLVLSKAAQPHVFTRLVWLIVATLQVTRAAVATIAEARVLVEANLADAGLHIESEGPRHNSPVHRDDCAVCQYLSSRSSPTEVYQFAARPESSRTGDILRDVDRHDLLDGLSLPLPRAPPLS